VGCQNGVQLACDYVALLFCAPGASARLSEFPVQSADGAEQGAGRGISELKGEQRQVVVIAERREERRRGRVQAGLRRLGLGRQGPGLCCLGPGERGLGIAACATELGFAGGELVLCAVELGSDGPASLAESGVCGGGVRSPGALNFSERVFQLVELRKSGLQLCLKENYAFCVEFAVGVQGSLLLSEDGR
jgi:hypothetical protein